MLKNYFLALVAVLALLVAGCSKPDTPKPDSNKDNPTDTQPGGNDQPGNDEPGNDEPGNDEPGKDEGKITAADFVGTWGQGEDTDMLVLKEDGTFSEKGWEETIAGKWAYNENDSTITMTPDGGDAVVRVVLLIGGKAWLVFIEENGEGEYKSRFTNSYRKAGATVKSAPLGDGRWDSPHSGFKPAEYNDEADYRICLVVAGNKIDLYVPMWGYHIQGTFTQEDGRIKISTDDDHIWAAKEINVVDSYDWYFGWNAWGDGPDAGPSMNPETFELNGYTWYTVNELKNMGHAPDPDKPDHTFETAIWEAAQQLHDEAMDLCDFELCVTDDGKEAFGGAVGLTPWFYKR